MTSKDSIKNYVSEHKTLVVVLSIIGFVWCMPLVVGFWIYLYWDSIVNNKMRTFKYTMCGVGCLLAIMSIVFGPMAVKEIERENNIERYISVLSKNRTVQNKDLMTVNDESIEKIYGDSLIADFNELTIQSKMDIWDKYMERGGTEAASLMYHISPSKELESYIMNTIPEKYDKLSMQINCQIHFEGLLKQHHFDSQSLDFKLINIERARVYEPIYKVVADVRYKNAFNATVEERVVYIVNRHQQIERYYTL